MKSGEPCMCTVIVVYIICVLFSWSLFLMFCFASCLAH